MNFEPVHCQMDYFDESVTIFFRGKYDEKKAIQYMLKSYGSFNGRRVVEVVPHSYYKGYENWGYVTFGK